MEKTKVQGIWGNMWPYFFIFCFFAGSHIILFLNVVEYNVANPALVVMGMLAIGWAHGLTFLVIPDYRFLKNDSLIREMRYNIKHGALVVALISLCLLISSGIYISHLIPMGTWIFIPWMFAFVMFYLIDVVILYSLAKYRYLYKKK